MTSAPGRPDETGTDIQMRAVHEMIQMAYQVAVEPERFDDLIATWDAFFDMVRDDPNAALVGQHFSNAERIANDPRLDRAQNLDAILSLIAAPALVVDATGGLVATNEPGQATLSLQPGTNMAPLLGEVWMPDGPGDAQYFRCDLSGRTLLAACSRIPVAQDGDSVFLIRLEASHWSDAMTQTLRDTYALSTAEIDMTRRLHDGNSLNEIAAQRGRSLETVRSQLKAVLNKTNASKQAELLQLLTRLQYVLGASPNSAPPSAKANDPTGFVVQTMPTDDNRNLAYAIYGAPQGREVLYLTTSSLPQETAAWRSAVDAQGLKVIAPYRPGFGSSDPVKDRSQLIAHYQSDCAKLMLADFDGPLVVAGHREGGILAAQIAPGLRDSRTISGVCLISAGAPKFDLSRTDDDNSMQRSVAALKVYPQALRLGYRAAKRVFDTGPRGETQIIKYFCKSNDIDRNLIRSSEFWKIVRENIAFCFEQTDIIVDDIALWASRWDQDIDGLDQLETRFILGAEHDFLGVDDLREYCASHPKFAATIRPRMAQLMLYQDPVIVAQTISDLHRDVTS